METRIHRRTFVKHSALAAAAITGVNGNPRAGKAEAAGNTPKQTLIWGDLLHLSYNMWEDWIAPQTESRGYRPFLRFDEPLWNELLQKMTQNGLNLVVIDLGDGVQYQSHPEIAVKGAWPVKKLRQELAKIRRMGLEPIPKLNFATTHDAWLGKYSRMVSTDIYYGVCADLIAEVCDIFAKPRFFHLGLDEETARHQHYYKYVAVRQHDLWWNDFYFYVEQVLKGGSRPWMWSDYLWRHPDLFLRKMPKTVVQSNWYYSTHFKEPNHPDYKNYIKAYLDLDKHGYDQIPTGSNHSTPVNFGMTVEYCRKHISPDHLLGFLQTPWRPTLPAYCKRHLDAIEQVGRAREIVVNGK